MQKKVNIYPQSGPITALSVPIRSNIMNATINVEDIRKIIMQGGAVKEILPDGSTVSLNLNNYDKTDLFELVKKEREEEQARIAQEKIEEKKRAEEISKKKSARQSAIDALKARTAQGPVVEGAPKKNTKVEAVKAEAKEDKVQSTIDDVRAKIEANKHKNN